MPRKSTGGVSVGGGSQPSTPKSRKSISTDSPLPLNPDESITTTSANASLSIPTTSKAVLKQQEVALRGIESFELPRGPLIKFAKTTLPDSTTLRKDTQSAIVRSASVFISYLTSTAHDNAKAKKGKIIGAQHVIDALRDLDFTHEEVKEIKDHLRAYREAAAKKKEKSKESKDGATGEGEKDGDQSLVEDALEVEEEYEEEAAEQEEDDEGADQLMDED